MGLRNAAPPTRSSMLIAVAVLVCGSAAGNCAGRRVPQGDLGIPACRADAFDQVLSPAALQCWFIAPHGRWRILSHESHYDVLVVNIETAALRDADHIANRLVAQERNAFAEIMVYAQSPSTARVRRVRWMRSSGFDALEFEGSAAP